jgi:thioredoxin 1
MNVLFASSNGRKYAVITITLVGLVIAFFLTCVQGPTIVEDQLHNPERAINLTLDNFDSLVLRNSVIALVEFYQPGCNVCGSMMWIIDSLATAGNDSVLVGAVNVDSNAMLLERFAIDGIPAYILFYHGESVARRSFFQADSLAFDTLSLILQKGIEGLLVSDTADTGTTVDTSDTALTTYLTLDTLTFDSTVLQQGRVAMVFFLYAGGLPCIHMDSVVMAILPQFEGRAVIAKVHAWEQYPLSDRYGITQVPQFLFFKDGAEVVEERRLGVFEGSELTEVIDKLLEE